MSPSSDVTRLKFQFETKFAHTIIAKGDVTFQTGAWVVGIQGSSGGGKTTFLRWLAGLNPLSPGELKFGEKIWQDQNTFLAPQLRRIGWLAQGDHIFPHLTVAENIGYGLSRLPKAERTQRVQALIQRIGLEALSHRRPHNLSGGEKRRVGLAQVLAIQPQLLLLDEPFAGLDDDIKQNLIIDLKTWIEQFQIPTLLVSHSVAELSDFASHTLKFQFEGSDPDRIFRLGSR